MALGSEFSAEFAIVVDFAVQNHDESAVVREHRLMAGAAGIDDRQAAMAEADALSRDH